MNRDVPDTSIAALVRGLITDIRTLIREEIALARVEVREQAGRARAAAVAFAVAAGTLAFAGTFLLIAAATGIAHVLAWPTWAGFLVVAVALAVVGVIALVTGRRALQHVHALPAQTVTTLKENSEWITKRLTSAPR